MNQEPTVLIVDDVPVNVKLLEAIFRKEGFRTLTAENGPAGRAQALTEHPDLILLDIMMPEESGFETCSKLKADPQTTDIPVIFISAMDDAKSKVKGLTIGAFDYITKPFDKEEVLARSRLHIKLKQAYDAVAREQASKLKQLQEAQNAILVSPSDFPDANFGVFYKPLQEAGGDFYDVVRISDGIFGYFVADISGHDLGASYITPALKALISQNAGPLHAPDETIKMVNRVIRSLLVPGQHLTATYLHLNRMRNGIILISAGHLPIIFLSHEGHALPIAASGDILGAFETITVEPVQINVSKGDRLFLYTDGMVEDFGEKKMSREQGIDALLTACRESRLLPLAHAVDAITDKLFPEGSRAQDDRLLLAVEV